MTNLALAISLDPQFPELAQELVFMGGSLSPQTDNPEFLNNPRHEFNFWFDPEAAEIVLRAPWKKIVCTPTDISVKTHMTAAMVKQIEASGTPLARYIAKFAMLTPGADIMWDELAAAAWIDPTIITKSETRYMGVDLDRGAGYGNTLTWPGQRSAGPAAQPVEIQVDLDTEKFYRMFVGADDGRLRRAVALARTSRPGPCAALAPKLRTAYNAITSLSQYVSHSRRSHHRKRRHGCLHRRPWHAPLPRLCGLRRSAVRHVGDGRQSRRLEGFRGTGQSGGRSVPDHALLDSANAPNSTRWCSA